jgi:dihydroorotase
MKLLLKQVTINDQLSPFNGNKKDILIVDGIISEIDDTIEPHEAEIFDEEDVSISQGWIDTFAHFNDPGLEYKETLETGAMAAAAGGFTHVFVIPNTKPVICNKSSVEYIVQKSKSLAVNIHPLGAITKNAEGNELAEMYDMFKSGAVAFSDGQYPVQIPGLLLKALQYIKTLDGTIIQLPMDRTIGKHGLMHEGITSTRLGLPGIPAIAEELIVSRDIELAKYTESKLHISGISTRKSLELITAAKKDGIKVSCSVTPYHLSFCDEDLVEYSTNLKVDPPLRLRDDMMALREGLVNGAIDCVATHHMPQDTDNKICEFEYAKNGMIGLESCFSVINTLFPTMPAERLIEIFSSKAREIFSLPKASIKVGAHADFTLFNSTVNYTFSKNHIKSRSKNTPFLNRQFIGKAIGIINKDKLYLNK